MKKVLTIIGITLGAFLAIFFIGAALLPGDYEVERSIIIEAPREAVYAYTTNLRTRQEWSPWAKADETAVFKYAGTGKQVGDSYSWTGNKMGEGQLTIKVLDPPERFVSELQFVEPFEDVLEEEILFEPAAGNTKVYWISRGNLPYPLMRWFGLILPDQIGAELEQGLQLLKQELERSDSASTAI